MRSLFFAAQQGAARLCRAALFVCAMVTYSYITDDGELFERQFRMGSARRSIRLPDGRRASRCFAADHVRKRSGKCWPRFSDALGVHPDQIPEAVAEYKRNGVKVEFNAEGQLKMDNRSHQNDVLKAGGWANYDAGYGDRSPVSRCQTKGRQ